MEALESVTGVIFNLQHFCLHDGPGIRTNVFLKGCPLRCRWCANPESQHKKPQILWNWEKCTGCGACEAACPTGAITREEGAIRTDSAQCTGCGACVAACPHKARELSGRVATAGEVLQEVMEDRLFYGDDGGMTLTGGEVLSQPEFALALLRLAKERGLHTAVETSGFGSWEALGSLAPFCDLFLYDCKHTLPEGHKRCTGQSNQLILENLGRLSQEFPEKEIWLRVPVIPGWNDSTENMEGLSALASATPGCSRVELLPYHNLGEGKRQQLGEEPFPGQVPTEEHMEALRQIVRACGKPVV